MSRSMKEPAGAATASADEATIRDRLEAWAHAVRSHDLDELSIIAGTDVAFAHAILLVRGEQEASTGSVRLTVGLHKIDGNWTVVHEHHSAPYQSA